MWIKEDKHVCGVEPVRDMVQVRDDGGLARRWGAGKKADGFRIPALTLTSTD